MALGEAIVPAASISSLMVGVMTKDDTTLLVKNCQSSTLSSSSSVVSSGEMDSQDDNKVIIEFQQLIRKAWLEKPKEAAVVAAQEDNEQNANRLLEKMIGDEAQLGRILVARKYEMDASVSLFLEQLRFRAKWKPSSIQPEDIPNALPCK